MNGHVPLAQQMARGLPMLRILWGAIFASSVAMFVAARVSVFAAQPETSPVIGPILFVVGCLCGLFGVIYVWAQLAGALKRRPPTPALVMTGAIIGLALNDSVAMCGLMLAILQAPGSYGIALFAISWSLFVARFPTLSRPLGVLGPALDLRDPEPGTDALR